MGSWIASVRKISLRSPAPAVPTKVEMMRDRARVMLALRMGPDEVDRLTVDLYDAVIAELSR